MNQVGDNLEYDHNYIELVDFFEGEVSDSMVVTDEGNDSKEQLKRIKKDLETLINSTVDIRLYVYNVLYYLNSHYYSGFISSLRRLTENVRAHWDSCYPQLDDSDDSIMEIRQMIFSLLTANAHKIKSLEVVSSERLGSWSLNHWHAHQNNDDVESVGDLSALIESTDIQYIHSKVEEIIGLKAELDEFSDFISEAMGTSSHPFNDLVTVLDDVLSGLGSAWHISQVQTQQTVDVNDISKLSDIGTASSQTLCRSTETVVHLTEQNIHNKQDALELLKKISTYFKENEPSSPVSCLLDQTIRLATKDFIGVLEELAPDSVASVKSVFGITNDNE